MTINTTTERLFLNEETTWFMADPHLNHDKIRKFSNRPFADLTEMNEAITSGLHSCVKPGDTLVILGDLTWNRKTDEDVKSLPGKHKILVKGNHEKPAITNSRHWTRACDYLEANIGMADGSKRLAVLFHYPMASWINARTSYHLHGHTHGCIPPMATEFGGRLDVGVDVCGFLPVRLRDVIRRIDELRLDGYAVPGDY